MSVELLDFLEEFRQEITFADVKKIFGNDTAIANFNIAKREGFIGLIKGKGGKYCLTETGEYEVNRLKERKEQEQEIIDIQKKQVKISQTDLNLKKRQFHLAIFTIIVLALNSWILYNQFSFSSQLNSPQIIFSKTNCPEPLYTGVSQQTEILFGNYGKMPASISFNPKIENVVLEEISPLVNYNYTSNSDIFRAVPIEQRSMDLYAVLYNVKVENSSINESSFSIFYSLTENKKYNDILTKKCDYIKDMNSGLFMLNKK